MHIELRDVHKTFGTVHANRGISLEIRPGTVHGILGENGAGKSTLMKILAGYTARTRGEILVDGVPAEWRDPSEATRRGIGMLYQDPLDFPPLTAAENYLLGSDAPWHPDVRAAAGELAARAEPFGFPVYAQETLEPLTIGERQQLELLRLLSLGAQVLILDEPTTGISDVQKETLFRALRKLAGDGRSIVLVSHKLEDVQALCDRVTVLRHGAVAGEAAQPFDVPEILRLMFGETPAPPPRCHAEPGPPVLQLHRVSASGGRAGLRECSISLRRGETVGLAGVEGSGQGVFLRVAAGVRRPLEGRVEHDNRAPALGGAAAQRRAGVVFLPAGRLEEGLISGLTVQEHYALNLPRPPFFAPWKRAARPAREGIDRYRIRGEPQSPVETLSGGNQQRLLLSLIPERPSLLLLENPTRGLDLESTNWVWGQLRQYCDQGATIVFSSAELDEILQASDRVLVFFEGRVVADVRTAETDPAALGRAIAGFAEETAR